MIIGVPREIMPDEGRVALLPQQVRELIQQKRFQVMVEAGAGVKSLATDSEYTAAGAAVIHDVKELYAKCRTIVKVKEPQYNPEVGAHEVDLMNSGTILITFIHPAAPENHSLVRSLSERGITAFTMDGIPRISRAQSMDALSSMSTIAGYKAVITAANILPRFVPMMTTAAGMIPPAKFLVIGVGVVGLQAIATAKRLGGVVSFIDIRSAAREAGRSLGAREAGWDIPAELAEGEGGYARALPVDWLNRERQIISQVAGDQDVLILSALVPGEKAPVLITREIVDSLKPGTVIMDVSIDQGGNCEITRPGEEWVTPGGVHINGFKNLPGRLPAHASLLYSKNMAAFLLNLWKPGEVGVDLEDEINRSALVTYEGKIMHQGALKAIAG
jgi:NAD(P) transhydrogenase subunit alpha